MKASIRQCEIFDPKGDGPLTAWEVKSEDCLAIFTGIDAHERAATFARANYKPIEFVMEAESGHIGMTMGNA